MLKGSFIIITWCYDTIFLTDAFHLQKAFQCKHSEWTQFMYMKGLQINGLEMLFMLSMAARQLFAQVGLLKKGYYVESVCKE